MEGQTKMRLVQFCYQIKYHDSTLKLLSSVLTDGEGGNGLANIFRFYLTVP